MAFRLLFWENMSQNNNLVDSLAQQAEDDFRNAYVDDFHILETTSANQSDTLPGNTVSANQISALDSDSTKNAVISELIQTVNNNIKTEIVSNDLSPANSVFSDIKESVSNSLDSISSAAAKQELNLSAKTTASEQINSVAESIKSVSQALDNEIGRQQNSSINPDSSGSQATTVETNQLLQKLKSYLDDLRNKITNLLDGIQKPQIQHYYGVEDAIKDAGKRDLISQNERKQQEIIEKNLLKKTLDIENNAKIKRETLLKEQLVKKENQTELENILTKRIDEARKRSLFETDFLPK
jgi:hypothetical protein